MSGLTMTRAQIEELATEAADKALTAWEQKHSCRFTREERALLHQIHSDLSRDDLITLGKAARLVNVAVGQVARAIVIGLVVLAFMAIGWATVKYEWRP